MWIPISLQEQQQSLKPNLPAKMKPHNNFILVYILFQTLLSIKGLPDGHLQNDRYRPEFHFSISEHWINDPNGMVYLDGEYHLHYQYYPEDSVWGPMHWGHAVSQDLVHWEELPIALYPDELGYIFSGSAVADFNNTAGFQNSSEVVPIIAIFTHAGDVQQQSIAYSLDHARTYTKYDGNPVIPNPGIVDYRDPKVIDYEGTWVQLLAAGNKIMFYRSEDLKSWEYASEFGADPEQGSHDGVWECPDLIKIENEDFNGWVLIVSINPGGPNGGSVTQYFVGDFDGHQFTSSQFDPLWMDWGVDNYASVSFFNEPQGRHIFMGWMNNWQYANVLPTEGWRGQMTLPRVLDVVSAEGRPRLVSQLADEVKALYMEDTSIVDSNYILEPDSVYVPEYPNNTGRVHLDMSFDLQSMSEGSSLAICFLNSLAQELCVGYDKGVDQPIFLNRELSGRSDFHAEFSRRLTAQRELSSEEIRIEVLLDVSAVELFVDSGLTCMTALYYPDEVYRNIEIRHHANGQEDSLIYILSGFVQGIQTIL